jgi:hypothetical protein
VAFTPKNWQDLPSISTPISAAALEDLETRLGQYADSVAGAPAGAAVPKALVDAKGDLLVGAGDDTVEKLPLPTNFNDHGSTLFTNPSTSSGLDWSVKSADVNIMQAGAVAGAGVSSGVAAANTTAINNAFLAASGEGRPCFIPPVGPFMIGPSQVRMPSNLHVRGFGKDRSILKVHAGVGLTSTELIINYDTTNGNSNITLENFEIDGNRDARGGVPWQPDPWGAGQLNFRASNSASPCRAIRLLNMTMHHALGVGTGFKHVDDLLVQGCLIYSNGRDGCSCLGQVKHVRYIGNHIWGCGDDCIAITHQEVSGDSNSDVTLIGNVVGEHPNFNPGNTQYGGHGFCFAGPVNVTCVGNTIDRAGYGGIQISDGYPTGNLTKAARIVIANNTIQYPGAPRLPTGVNDSGYGIEVTQKFGSTISEVTIANNIIFAPMSHMVYLGGWSHNTALGINWMRITGNQFLGEEGGNYWADAGGVVVSDMASNFVTVSNNLFRDLRGKAIDGANFACTGWTIADNEFYGCEKGAPGAGGAAINIPNFVDPHVRDNRVHDFAVPKNQSHAINWNAATGARVSGNDFTGAGRTGTTTGTLGAGGIQHANVDNNGVLQDAGTGGAVDLSSTVAVEELEQSVMQVAAMANTPTRVPVFVAKFPLKVVACSVITMTTPIAASNTDYWTVVVRRWRTGTGGDIATKTTRVSDGEAVALGTDWNFDTATFGATQTLQVGDICSMGFTPTGTPTPWTNFLVTVRYEPL